MEMKRINAGKLRAIGYAPRERRLRVELDTGVQIEHCGVGEEIWRRLATSGSAWSYYRDNIEEEFAARTLTSAASSAASDSAPQKPNPLDDLFSR